MSSDSIDTSPSIHDPKIISPDIKNDSDARVPIGTIRHLVYDQLDNAFLYAPKSQTLPGGVVQLFPEHIQTSPNVPGKGSRRETAHFIKNLQHVSYGSTPRYEINLTRGMISTGGHAATYRALDLKTGENVVAKIGRPIAIKTQDNQTIIQSPGILDEARKMANLSHPNIPRVHDLILTQLSTDESGNQLVPVFIMELAGTESLQQAYLPNLTGQDKLNITEQIGNALAYCHRKGIVHRDVRPDNITYSRQTGTAMLVDFGVYLTAQELPQDDVATHFSSIEQISNEPVQTSMDTYGYALVVYCLLTNQKSFNFTDFEGEIDKLNPAFQPIFRKALQQNKEDRGEYIVVETLKEDLVAQMTSRQTYSESSLSSSS